MKENKSHMEVPPPPYRTENHDHSLTKDSHGHKQDLFVSIWAHRLRQPNMILVNTLYLDRSTISMFGHNKIRSDHIICDTAKPRTVDVARLHYTTRSFVVANRPIVAVEGGLLRAWRQFRMRFFHCHNCTIFAESSITIANLEIASWFSTFLRSQYRDHKEASLLFCFCILSHGLKSFWTNSKRVSCDS